ncbi:retrovirus-related pol polyprotein from transposon tnt 1-94 [Gossypium australe]|uniref:Retrovirus-related pol polyprotein from transposon tnt 1-94 n=1 Tax=Gossypium australe TaxID=47621 RepID=A0A5B6WCK3_9ROSI|nr:retrovirus-related pol polyprotein from transposon tnt 1-94 [Gossypium australe]
MTTVKVLGSRTGDGTVGHNNFDGDDQAADGWSATTVFQWKSSGKIRLLVGLYRNYILFFGCTPISWLSKKQPTITRSFTEAKYRAITIVAIKTLRVLHLLQEHQGRHIVVNILLCKTFLVNHIHATDQLADTFTKALPKLAFVRQLSKLGVVPQPQT